MSFYKKQNLFQRVLFSQGTVIVLFFLIIFVGFGVVSLVGKSVEAARARKQSEARASELAQKQVTLSTKIDALETPEGKEAALREQFPVVKDGEQVIVINDEPLPKEAAETNGSSKGFWHFLKNLFTSNK